MPKFKTSREKRKSQRLYIVFPVKYKLPDENKFHQAVACQDISGKGIRLLLDKALDTNQEIGIRLYPEKSPKPVNALCRVVWCSRNKDGTFQSGLEFINIKEQGCFTAFLAEEVLDFGLSNNNRR